MTEKPIAGKLYANWCGHCNALETPWKEMKKRVGGSVDVVGFEADTDKKELAEFQKKHPVEVQGGYPTLFRIEKGGKIEYYNGGRDTESLVNWALGKHKKISGGTRRKTRRNTKRKNSKTRRHR